MKSVILAAGKGTRMRDLTQEMPKPMLRVQGRPILQHIVEGLVAAGIRDICIVTGWRAEVIEDFFGDGSRTQSLVMTRATNKVRFVDAIHLQRPPGPRGVRLY